jgi:hypothetical protein
MKITTLPALVGLLLSSVAFAAAAAGKLSFTSSTSLLLTEDITQTPMAPITITRSEGSDGRVTAQVRADAAATCPVSENYPVLRYRLQAADAWINLPWEGSIPITFADGQTEVSFQIGAVDNDAWEGTQPLTGAGGLMGILRLENISSPAAAGSFVARTIRVSGNDPRPVMTVVPLSSEEGNGGGLKTRHLRVNLDRPVARAVISCDLTVEVGGTATSGADYTLPWAAPNSSALPAYVQSFDVPVHIVADSVIEPDETILTVVSLRAQTAGPGSDTLTLESAATITILNDEFPPVIIGGAAVDEGQAGTASMVFPVSLAAALPADVSFNWTTVSGTGAGQATEGSDFVAASGTVLIPAGQTAASITVTVNGDTVPEEDESLLLNLSAAVGLTLPEGSTSGLIVDDDRPRIVVGSPRVVEGNLANTPMVFPVTLTIPQQVPVTFEYSFAQIWANDAALEGNDYIAASGTVTIPPGSTTASFSVVVVGDTFIEPDEFVRATLTNASGAVLPAGPVIGWIQTDDFPQLGAPHTWTLGERDVSFIHNIAFMMSGPTSPDARVDWSIDAPPGSITPTSGTLYFSIGITTMDFTVLGDEIPENDFTINITFSNPVGFLLPPGGPSYPLISLVDDDRRMISVSGGSVAEGNAGTTTLPFTVALGSALPRDLTFNYTTSGGTATAGQDYTAASGTATIPAGQTSTTIDVTVTGDTQIELDETVGLTLSGFSLPTDQGTVIPGVILTEDFPPGPAPQATMVTEASGTGTVQAWFAVDLSAARTVPFSCRVRTRSGTALAGSDFNALAPTDITFAAGETRQWVAITVTAAPEAEAVEQFFLDVVALDSHEIKSAACTIERLAVTDFWRPSPGIYAIRFPSGLGQRYIVEEAASLAGPWIPVSSILTGSGFPVTQLMFSAADSAFFQVRVAPPLPPGTAAAGS